MYGSEEQIPCKWCGTKTSMLGTKECDGCWELRHRIENDIDMAKKMIKALTTEETPNLKYKLIPAHNKTTVVDVWDHWDAFMINRIHSGSIRLHNIDEDVVVTILETRGIYAKVKFENVPYKEGWIAQAFIGSRIE